MTSTDYGFEWGPVEVERITEYRGRRVLRVTGAGQNAIEIIVSPQGNRLTAYQRDNKGQWVKLEPDGRPHD